MTLPERPLLAGRLGFSGAVVFARQAAPLRRGPVCAAEWGPVYIIVISHAVGCSGVDERRGQVIPPTFVNEKISLVLRGFDDHAGVLSGPSSEL